MSGRRQAPDAAYARPRSRSGHPLGTPRPRWYNRRPGLPAMISKRSRVVLLAALAAVGVLAACVAVVASREDPDQARFDNVREGMTRAEVEAIMGRPADAEKDIPRQAPLPPAHALEWFTAKDDQSHVILVGGKVAVKGRSCPPPPFWYRLRRWLHL